MSNDLTMIRFVKSNIDHCPQLQERFQILTVPALKYSGTNVQILISRDTATACCTTRKIAATAEKKEARHTTVVCRAPFAKRPSFWPKHPWIPLISQNLWITFSSLCTL